MKLPELEPSAYGVLEQDDQFTTWDFICGWPEAGHEHIADQINEWKDSGETPPNYSVIPLVTLSDAQQAIAEAYAQGKKDAIPEGYTLVPTEILDAFPEINPGNYDHDDARALNAWGVELVIAAAPKQEKNDGPV